MLLKEAYFAQDASAKWIIQNWIYQYQYAQLMESQMWFPSNGLRNSHFFPFFETIHERTFFRLCCRCKTKRIRHNSKQFLFLHHIYFKVNNMLATSINQLCFNLRQLDQLYVSSTSIHLDFSLFHVVGDSQDTTTINSQPTAKCKFPSLSGLDQLCYGVLKEQNLTYTSFQHSTIFNSLSICGNIFLWCSKIYSASIVNEGELKHSTYYKLANK